MVLKKPIKPGDDNKEWENPFDPEAPLDARDKEQIERQVKEAQRRKDNLTGENENDKQTES